MIWAVCQSYLHHIVYLRIWEVIILANYNFNLGTYLSKYAQNYGYIDSRCCLILNHITVYSY